MNFHKYKRWLGVGILAIVCAISPQMVNADTVPEPDGVMGQSEVNAVQVDLPCRPCSVFGKKACHRGDYACLNRIEPVEIADKVESILMRK